MKKTLRYLALVCVMALLSGMMSGCGDGASDDVEVFNIWTDSSTPLEEEQVVEFNETIGKENGIKIELTNYGSDYAKTVEMAIANDNAPDFFKAQGSLKAQVEKGNLFPVSDLPDVDQLLKDYEHMLAEGTHKIGDDVYSVPGRRVVYGFLYNKDMFKEAGIVDENGEAKYPKTWDEVVEYAKRMTNPKKSQYGIIFPMKWTAFWGSEVGSVVPIYSGRTNFDYANDRYDFSNYKPILEKVMEIKESGALFPGSESLDNDAARAQFATGRVAMKMGASWDVYVLNEQFPAECEWGACPIPKMEADGTDYYQKASVEALINVSSSVKGKDLKKVALVYKWFYSDERIGELYQNADLIPAKADIIDNYKVTVDKQGQSDFGEIAKLADKPATPAWITIKYEGETYQSVFDKVWAGMITIDQAVKQLNKDYNEAYKKATEENDMEPYYSIPLEVFDSTMPDEIKKSSRFLGGK
ncbi:MAG: extracellular solute-binding protein [Clostridia bacterium]|nr:extracellular solute-binding protein [Clostridia bacterium]